MEWKIFTKLSEQPGVNVHTVPGSSFAEDYDKPLQIKWGIAQINKKKAKKATKIYSKLVEHLHDNFTESIDRK